MSAVLSGTRRGMIRRALWQGSVAGVAGGVVMTLGEKAEQALTGRPDSHVPARVLQRLTGLPERPGTQPLPVNWAMHYGQAAALGVLRSVMAQAGLRGPLASAKFAIVRLTNDQILENATGVGAPPATWPRAELVLDACTRPSTPSSPEPWRTGSRPATVPVRADGTPPCAPAATPTSGPCAGGAPTGDENGRPSRGGTRRRNDARSCVW